VTSPRIITDGADGFQLVADDDRVIGWVRGRAVGITGFDSEATCIVAAVASYRALASWLERNRLPALAEITTEPVTLVHDGAHRWIRIGRAPVARLLVDGTHDARNPPRYAFEIVMRGQVLESAAIHAAIIAFNAARPALEPCCDCGSLHHITLHHALQR
jgi:hypothetical protein